MGYDNTFGCDGRSLGLEDYFRLGREENVAVEEAPVLQGVSSTLVREALAGGRVGGGCPYAGKTIYGGRCRGAWRHLGRELGFPTANVDHDIRMVLRHQASMPQKSRYADGTLRIAVVNVGTRPHRIKRKRHFSRAHIPDFRGDLYGKDVSVRFIRRIP